MDIEQQTPFRAFHDYRWDEVACLPYKEDGTAPFKAISRQVLFAEPRLGCELRYFEMAAGGYSTLERHEHMHAVMILRGHGRCLVGEDVRAVKPFDLVTIPSWTWHQFRADRRRAAWVPLHGECRARPAAVADRAGTGGAQGEPRGGRVPDLILCPHRGTPESAARVSAALPIITADLPSHALRFGDVWRISRPPRSIAPVPLPLRRAPYRCGYRNPPRPAHGRGGFSRRGIPAPRNRTADPLVRKNILNIRCDLQIGEKPSSIGKRLEGVSQP